VRSNTDGAAYAVRGIVIDISERIHAEEELRKADRRKDEFLAMLAHELRNPLAPISTAAEVLRFAGTNPERVRTTSEIISRQVKHMTNLIDDLLDVSRVTRGLIELEHENLEIESIVLAAVEQARPLLDARGHVLTLHVDSAKAVVSGDRTRLVQTLSNLLNNAAKYTPQGGSIDLTVEAADGKVRISVKDNGIGIEPALLPHLFDLFTQGRRTSDRAQGGLGLGLALVKSLLAMHGGVIDVRSEGTDMGSLFVITLPCTSDAAPAGTAAPHVATAPVGPLRIMVVDDNRDAGQSLATLLQACGHAVLVAADGPEALRLAASERLDAFILDIGLPGMNGYELARQLRSAPAHAQATLIALTGYSQAHDRVLSKGAGFAHHLVKPVVLAELELALRDAAGSADRRQASYSEK
jgi:CheY-like chemotaxis protein